MRQTIRHVAKFRSCAGMAWVLRQDGAFRIVLWSLKSGRRKTVDEFPFLPYQEEDALRVAKAYCNAHAERK
jgi:hypothetical protein